MVVSPASASNAPRRSSTDELEPMRKDSSSEKLKGESPESP